MDMGESYVVVVNRKSSISLRHIITVHEPYDEAAFVAWYYDNYWKLDGDEFVYCSTRKDRDDFLRALEEGEV